MRVSPALYAPMRVPTRHRAGFGVSDAAGRIAACERRKHVRRHPKGDTSGRPAQTTARQRVRGHAPSRHQGPARPEPSDPRRQHPRRQGRQPVEDQLRLARIVRRRRAPRPAEHEIRVGERIIQLIERGLPDRVASGRGPTLAPRAEHHREQRARILRVDQQRPPGEPPAPVGIDEQHAPVDRERDRRVPQPLQLPARGQQAADIRIVARVREFFGLVHVNLIHRCAPFPCRVSRPIVFTEMYLNIYMIIN